MSMDLVHKLSNSEYLIIDVDKPLLAELEKNVQYYGYDEVTEMMTVEDYELVNKLRSMITSRQFQDKDDAIFSPVMNISFAMMSPSQQNNVLSDYIAVYRRYKELKNPKCVKNKLFDTTYSYVPLTDITRIKTDNISLSYEGDTTDMFSKVNSQKDINTMLNYFIDDRKFVSSTLKYKLINYEYTEKNQDSMESTD